MAQSVKSRLEFADKVRLVEYRGHSEPYFRMHVNIVDETGTPLKVLLPGDLKKAITVVENGSEYHPFYVDWAGDEPGPAYAMLLIDISGSMLDQAGNQTKFDAAKAAATHFVQGFPSQKVYMAVAAFESHMVKERIRSVQFTDDVPAVQRQIDGLIIPKPNFNTGLYSAVVTGLVVLEEKKKKGPSAQMSLIVLTDGQNEKLKGDDNDLLDGAAGLNEVIERAGRAGIQIFTIGFGDEAIPLGRKGAIDSEALRKIAWPTSTNFRSARNQIDLSNVFDIARRKLVDRLRLTFATADKDRTTLTGRSLRFSVKLKLDDGTLLLSDQVLFPTPVLVVPPFEDTLDAKEIIAIIGKGPSHIFPLWLWRLMILIVAGAILAALWFRLPRYIWPVPPETLVNYPKDHHFPRDFAEPPAIRFKPGEKNEPKVVFRNAGPGGDPFRVKPRRPNDVTQ
jgi:hypothetical protein